MKKFTLSLICLTFVFSQTALGNIIPLIKQGLAVGITPNPSVIKASDFDAGSFIEGGGCNKAIIFSFDANGQELTKDLMSCVGIKFVDIYMTNACDPNDQAKVSTYLEVQNNLLLPNLTLCPSDGFQCSEDSIVLTKPTTPVFPMPLVMNGIAVTPAENKGTCILNWDNNVNSGSQPNSGSITDKHIHVGGQPLPSIKNLPSKWEKSIDLNACCAGLQTIDVWAKNSAGNSNFVNSYFDMQKPAVNNPKQPVVYTYQGIATRYVSSKNLIIPAKIWNFGSYSPINSPLTFSYANGSISLKVDTTGLVIIDLVAKDSVGNKNSVGTYLDVQTETLMKGAKELKINSTVSTYTMTDSKAKCDWYLDSKLVASAANTYQTPANMSEGKHKLKALRIDNKVCSAKSILEIKVLKSVATEDAQNHEVAIYPNPISTHLFIETNTFGDYTVEISDLTGRTIQREKTNGTLTTVDCSALAPSIYFVKLLKDDKVVRVEKFVKR
jgi:Secretion system C-terminal sorting domain